MKPYELPPLDYDFAALEPHYSAHMLELHHDKHHKAYVDGVNTTLEKLAAARASDDLSAIVGLEKTLAFNLSGHVLHTLFWKNLSPHGGERPDGELAAAIDEHFGSFDAFKKQLTQSAATVQGSVGSLPAARSGRAVVCVSDLFPAGRFLLALCRVADAGSVSIFFLWIYTQRSRAETRTPVADPGGPEVRSPLLLPRGGGTLRNPARRRPA